MTNDEIRALVVVMRECGIARVVCGDTTIELGPAPAAAPPEPEAKNRLTPQQLMNRRKFAHVGG